ncbi:hypothetical protein FR992_24800 [Serratia marcescens]|nr:hypothetical protein FR992_24800 [Serratia marcescens]TYR93341.1 hypothetical protein FYK38_01180 [Serratia marcescens]HAU4338142.1 hypothetical protein [Serratia marcescens]
MKWIFMKRVFLSHGSTSRALSRVLTRVLFAGAFPSMAATPSDTPERAASAIDAREPHYRKATSW